MLPNTMGIIAKQREKLGGQERGEAAGKRKEKGCLDSLLSRGFSLYLFLSKMEQCHMITS